jgi:hypothetical protein
MSRLLEAAAQLDPQRAADLEASDAAELALEREALEFIARREQRFRETLVVWHALELDALRQAGVI